MGPTSPIPSRHSPDGVGRGSEVIWTRHRRPPDATPAIRSDFASAGFTELAFEAPDGYVLSVGRHRLDGDGGAGIVRPRPQALRVQGRRLPAGVSAGDGRGGEQETRISTICSTPCRTRAQARLPRPRPSGTGCISGRRGPYDRSIRPVRRPHPTRDPLHPLELLSMGLRTLRLEPGRVIVPALVIFGLDAFQSTWFTEIATDHLGWESVSDVVVFGVSTLGLTFYSGMLERLVGAVERNQTPQPVEPGPGDAAVDPADPGRRDPPRRRARSPRCSSSCRG